jgi:trk system potassium uptake protein TrkH
LVLIKNGFLEFKRALHPSAVLPLRYNNKSISGDIVFNILGFFILYMLLFITGALVFSFFNINFESAIGLSASSLGNVGPALGDFGPVNNYAALPDLAKLWSAFLMLVGRLELFTVLIILTPYFWRRQ